MGPRIGYCGLVVLLSVLPFGCHDSTTRSSAGASVNSSRETSPVEVLRERGDLKTTIDVQMSYLAACRAIVGELRKDLGDCVMHEIWPDIEQAGVLVSSPMRGGRAVSITIRATGPDRCRAEVFVNGYWKGRAYPGITRAIGTEPVAPTR
jgi:hypothetical protein